MAKKRTRKPHNAATYRPKAGPGQLFKRELIDGRSGYAKRFRNVASSPLQLAFWRGQLVGGARGYQAQDRLSAGEQFERLWYTLHRTGMRDSTDVGITGYTGLFFTEAKEQASARLHEIAGRMEATNYRIVQAFCGEGLHMAEALRAARVDAHPNGTAHRVREALDNLVYACTGWTGEGEARASARDTSTSEKLHPFLQIGA